MQLLNIEDIEQLKEENFSFVVDIERFYLLFNKIKFPITIIIEDYYNDRDYRDSFYHFFSSKYNGYSKHTKRIVIFEEKITKENLYDKNFNLEDKLIGVVTIKPLAKGSIGKTLFNPSKLNIEKCFLRTTIFEIGVVGRKLQLESFPFSSQDTEYMTCAETSVWSILQYYGTRYKEYKTALPHEIVNIVDDNHFQRVTPSKGLHYTHSSAVLKQFGFSSQIYYRFTGTKEYYTPDIQFKRLFHYYVESGIPLMVGIRLKSSTTENGHAVVCIGHKKSENKFKNKLNIFKDATVFNSADIVNSYVYMDDNKYPFYQNEFDKFDYSKYDDTKIKYFIVPLYKRIFLDAFEAEKTFYDILNNDIYGLMNIDDYQNKQFVIRIFLSTVRSYKTSRFKSCDKTFRILNELPMPKFIWICEISTVELYKEHKVIGEIILDATASKNDKFNQIILLRYPKKFAYKIFSEGLNKLEARLKINKTNQESSYDMLQNNLKEF